MEKENFKLIKGPTFRPLFYIVCSIILFWTVFAYFVFMTTSCGTPANKQIPNRIDTVMVRDTLLLRDTVTLRDTVVIYKHDTIRLESEGTKNLKAIIEHQNQMIRNLRKK